MQKTMNILFCGLNVEEFNRVSMCANAKEIWDTLETTHEGTNQVKKNPRLIFLYICMSYLR